MNKLKKVLKNPYKLFIPLAFKGMLNWMDDKTYLKFLFRATIGNKLDLKNPKTFSEKLQWLKLYDRNPEYTKMVDKYEAKLYVADKLGAEYVVKNYGVWDNFNDIDFDALPDQFVLKSTHDCGGLVICPDKSKLDIEAARKKIEKSLRRNYFFLSREWPYKNVKPRIIAEEFLSDASGDLKDYKMMCFNGKFECCFFCFDRNEKGKARIATFNKKWENMQFGRDAVYTDNVLKPSNYEKMIELAEKISKGHPFLRVDFYEVNEKLYLGELTFFPAGGIAKFTPEEWDSKLGDLIDLPITD